MNLLRSLLTRPLSLEAAFVRDVLMGSLVVSGGLWVAYRLFLHP